MKSFNVIIWDFNSNEFEYYDIIPYLMEEYRQSSNKYTQFNEFKKFILDKALYQWWSRCEYEIILSDWPCQQKSEKWDVYDQIVMNIDVITELFMSLVKQ